MLNRTPYSFLSLHALGWLCFANLVGVILALLLLVPSLNQTLAPFTYGRLVPVHLNGHLYGWCFLPLVGLLFALFVGRRASPWACRAVEVWSLALGVGCLYWLHGHSSGKLFMEWRGGARILLSLNMLFLAVVLAGHFRADPGPGRIRRWLKAALWLSLLPIPFVMYWAASPTLFPPVNPDSGGATGGSLLVSSLGAITIMWLTPFLLQLEHRVSRPMMAMILALQVLHYAIFFSMDHGDQSNYRPAEILGLASLLVWVPLLVVHFRCFTWPAASRPWLRAFAAWAAFLVVSANIMFLPGLLDRWKFTNFVVGHTHAAMAGMLSSFNLLVLIALNRDAGWSRILGDRLTFWSWTLGTLLHILATKGFGVFEGEHPDWLYYNGPVTDTFYLLRLFAGLLMLAAGAVWFLRGLAYCSRPEEVEHDG